MRPSALLFSFALAGLTAIGACSSSDAPAPTTADSGAGADAGGSSSGDAGGLDADIPDAVAPNTVEVSNFKYVPSKLTVKVGDTVTFVWKGGTHSVVQGTGCLKAAGGFDSGQHKTPFTFTQKFDTAGTFEYICDFMDHCAKGQVGFVEVKP